ncbi:angiopoietin-1 isoform X2 [Latimeria chalumnae]|uniref:Angiopoietin 4 n=1 Tax=Latimeria chalumnae TaxID=7897 RepID=H3A0H3_LATCH|nr:PREDICTED: angiopoietin-4 isoform X2 [Latimeria chalumnae]|eukprot:XP_014348285.1 PREDICTED: angiopoietin-4 isoform X2 [Latimeria chalumnae]
MQVLNVILSLIFLAVAASSNSAQRRASDGSRRRQHRVQYGQCSYTFVLPEVENCRGNSNSYNNALQRDSPPSENEWSSQKLQRLESMLENNTQWLQKLESYIQQNIKSEMEQIQKNAVRNHTVTMLEMGSSILTQSAEQTQKLRDVEAQVMNQTSKIETQLRENMLSTNKLEDQLQQQTNEINKLQGKNSVLENKVLEMEVKHSTELELMKVEKEILQQLVVRQSNTIEGLERQLNSASSNNSLFYRQQVQLMEAIHNLVWLVAQGKVLKKEEMVFRDCAEAYNSGFNVSGIYIIHINNIINPRKVYCDMETSGGGWMVIQRRANGSVDFQRTWNQYKQGFGDPAGEYWLGNEAVSLLTSEVSHTLRIDLKDWEGIQKYSQYERFHLGSEKEHYRIFLKDYSGSAGQQSSLVLHSTKFSTRDADNDNCLCRCAQMLTGGWWFDACGLSNLNGVYYPAGHNLRKLNGIKWHYFRGPSYSLQATSMMIRPTDF